MAASLEYTVHWLTASYCQMQHYPIDISLIIFVYGACCKRIRHVKNNTHRRLCEITQPNDAPTLYNEIIIRILSIDAWHSQKRRKEHTLLRVCVQYLEFKELPTNTHPAFSFILYSSIH